MHYRHHIMTNQSKNKSTTAGAGSTVPGALAVEDSVRDTASRNDGLENGYQRRRRATRRQLMEAGRALFIERDVEQVSIERITARAGVAKGSFYNHFASREALFDELLELTIGDLLAKYEAYDLRLEDPLENALDRARFTFYTLLSDRDACRLLLQGGKPSQGGAVDRVLRMVLADRLNEGIALGTLADVNGDLVYAAYFGVVTETIAHLLTLGEGFDAAEAAEQVTRLCFAVLGLPHRVNEGSPGPVPRSRTGSRKEGD